MEDHVADESRYFCMTRPIPHRCGRRRHGRSQEDPLDLLVGAVRQLGRHEPNVARERCNRSVQRSGRLWAEQ